MLYEVITLLVAHPLQLAGAALDGALDGVLGHVGRQGLVHRQAQARVGRRRITSYNVCYTKLLRIRFQKF